MLQNRCGFPPDPDRAVNGCLHRSHRGESTSPLLQSGIASFNNVIAFPLPGAAANGAGLSLSRRGLQKS
jgi:hypothetical protein